MSDIQLPFGGVPSADLFTAGQQAPEDFNALPPCARSVDASGLPAIRAGWLQAKSNNEEAMSFGRAAGLTKMEWVMAQLLQTKPN